MADDSKGLLTEVYIILLIIACGALLIALYHCISMLWWDLTSYQRRHDHREIQLQGIDTSIDNSVAGLIPAHKHKKVTGSEDDESMCAVCLSEFEEGEELRTLPDCMHTFHVPCIDMWLYSHRTCPICRMDAATLTSPLMEIIYIVDPQQQQQQEEVTRSQNLNVTEDLALQSMAP